MPLTYDANVNGRPQEYLAKFLPPLGSPSQKLKEPIHGQALFSSRAGWTLHMRVWMVFVLQDLKRVQCLSIYKHHVGKTEHFDATDTESNKSLSITRQILHCSATGKIV